MSARAPHAIVAALRRSDDGTLELVSPGVGLFRDAPLPGAVVAPGSVLGALEVLGLARTLVAPEGALGRVVPAGPARARRPVGYGDVLVRLDPGGLAAGDAPAEIAAGADAGERVFRSPMAGRYYARPSPGKPAFVQPGDEVEAGRTVALVEIMKTFNRVAYGGDAVPARCRVAELLVKDGDDVEAGTPMFRYEPL